MAAFVRSVTAVAMLGLVAKLFGFCEKVVLAYLEGARASVDAYVAAFGLAFPLYVLVEKIVVPAFVPIYVNSRKKHGTSAANDFARQIFTGIAIALLGIMVLMAWNVERLLSWTAPGFDEEQRLQAVRLLHWTLPGGFLLGLGSVTYAHLNACGRFAWPEASKVVYKGTTLLGIVALVPLIGVVGAGIASCAAALLQLTLLGAGMARERRLAAQSDETAANWPASRGAGRGPTQARLDRPTSPITTMPQKTQAVPWTALLALSAPLAVGAIAAQLSELVDNNLGSSLPTGSLAALSYSRKLADLPVVLLANVLAIVATPRFAEFTSAKQFDSLTQLLTRAIEFCLVLFVPLALVFILAPEPIVCLVFKRGHFDGQAVLMTSKALVFFSAGIIAFAAETLIVHAFYSTLDTRTPMIVGLVLVAVNIGLAIGLVPLVGIIAIPLALALQKTSKVMVLLLIFKSRYPGAWFRRLMTKTAGIGISGVAFGVAFRWSHDRATVLWPADSVGDAWALVGCASVAMLAYCGALAALRLVNLRRLVPGRQSRGTP